MNIKRFMSCVYKNVYSTKAENRDKQKTNHTKTQKCDEILLQCKTGTGFTVIS